MSVDLPTGISRTNDPMPGVLVETEACTGLVLDQGAHVLRWAPSGQSEVLFTSDHALFTPGKAIRGGIPVCWPWFDSGKEGKAPVRHGFARTADWRLVDASVTDGVATIAYELTGSDVDTHGFPTDVVARLEAEFGAELVVRLIVTAGAEAVEFEEALHTYLAVDDISKVRIEGLDGDDYLDTVGEPTQRTQTGEITFDGELDRVYSSTAQAVLVDGERTITVGKRNSRTTVVWNPGPELAGTMQDLGADQARLFCCVETANAKEHAVTLQPGQRHAMVATYRVG